MTFRETLRIAIRGLRANKMRTSLTMLGILIGVGAVIMLVAVGTGSSKAVRDRIADLGTNTLTVSRQRFARGQGGQTGAGTTRAALLTERDVDALRDKTNNPDLKQVAPVVNAQSVTGSFGGGTYSPAEFIGTTPTYASIRSFNVAGGSFFTDEDVAGHARNVVLGQTVVTNLFGNTDPIGQKVKFGANEFNVIGVLKVKGTNGNQDEDDIVFAPYTTVQDTLTGKVGGLSQIVLQAASSKATTDAQDEATATLRNSHRLTRNASDDFRIQNQATLLKTNDDANRVFTVLLGAVAAISLLVGGIGVMNIMLVTVTERTREIGIRKAIGARRADIVGQFLAEAVMLTVLGGVAGIAAGLIGSQFKIVGVQPVVAPYSVALAFAVAVAIGLFFGLYPANRAASLRPIDALRYE